MENFDDWLKLWHQPNIGPVSFQRLLSRFETPAFALSASDNDWKDAGLKASCIAKRVKDPDISADLKWLDSSAEHHLLLISSHKYPDTLKQLPAPPPLLYVRGDTDVLCLPQLSIVGSRHPTQSGMQSARAFSAHFAKAGLTITSGLAMGIDTLAHQSTLDADGITIAVCGTGLNSVYPVRNNQLADNIAATGALISEFPVNTQPRAENFPRRNRIISGISLGTLVVEAAQRSGSLITARYAMEQGRDVFAIPGSIHNPMARGCHRLIRQGAKLVETANDVLEELGPLIKMNNSINYSVTSSPETESENINNTATLNPEHQNILNIIDYDATTIDTIIGKSGLTAEEVSSILLILELEGRIASEPGGYFTRLAE